MMNKKSQFEVRDTRNGEWLWVYNALLADPHLSAHDKIVYAALASYSGFAQINPDYKQISERSSISQRTSKQSIKNLVDVGYISYEKGEGRGNTNTYVLLKKPKGCEKCTNTEKVQETAIKGANDGKEKVQEMHTLKTEIKDSIKTLSKDKEGNTFGNQEVNIFIETLKKEFDLTILDGTTAENRKYAYLAIKKCGRLDVALNVIRAAAADDFYGDKISNVKKLYYHMVEIVQKARGIKREVKNRVAPAYANTKNN